MSKRKQRDSTLPEPRPSAPAPAPRASTAPTGTAATRVDLVLAHAAFQRVVSRLEALPTDQVGDLHYSAELAAMTALTVVALCSDPAVRSRFTALATSGVWSTGALDALPDLAYATWYLHGKTLEARSVRTRAQLPKPLIAAERQRASRMAWVLALYFEEDAALGPVLAHLAKAQGHRGLAQRLLRYGELYAEHAATIAGAPRRYDPADGPAAIAAAHTMVAGVERDPGATAARWAELRRRAVTLLARCYDEVRDAGRFLERADAAKAAARFPELTKVSRKPRKRAKPAAKPAAPTPPTG